MYVVVDLSREFSRKEDLKFSFFSCLFATFESFIKNNRVLIETSFEDIIFN